MRQRWMEEEKEEEERRDKQHRREKRTEKGGRGREENKNLNRKTEVDRNQFKT